MQKKAPQTYLLKDVLPGVIASISRDNISEQINLEKAWSELAGPENGNACFAGFKDGCLFVSVTSSSCLYQWKIRKQMILRKLQERCSNVTNIVFKLGKAR